MAVDPHFIVHVPNEVEQDVRSLEGSAARSARERFIRVEGRAIAADVEDGLKEDVDPVRAEDGADRVLLVHIFLRKDPALHVIGAGSLDSAEDYGGENHGILEEDSGLCLGAPKPSQALRKASANSDGGRNHGRFNEFGEKRRCG